MRKRDFERVVKQLKKAGLWDPVGCAKAILRLPLKEVVSMKPGDTLTIYDDPITKKRPEGKGKLRKLVQDYGGGYQRWEIKFIGEREERPVCQRFIQEN